MSNVSTDLSPSEFERFGKIILKVADSPEFSHRGDLLKRGLAEFLFLRSERGDSDALNDQPNCEGCGRLMVSTGSGWRCPDFCFKRL